MSRSRYRVYSRASNGVEAAVDSVLYSIVTATAPLWVPVAAIYIGYLAFVEWRDSRAPAKPAATVERPADLPPLTPLILCRGLEKSITSADLDLRRKTLESYQQFGCAEILWKAGPR
jgi:hypothetical protein